MTTIGLTVGGVNRSNYVLEADIWRDTQTGIGRWQAILDPIGDFNLFGVFNADDAAIIAINGVTMMQGYVDDVYPYLDNRGYHTGLYRLTGRDRGMDLGQFFYKPLSMGGARGDYLNTLSGNIIRDVILNTQATFGAGNPEINAPGAGIGNALNYEWLPRTNLADGFREICLLDNHDFYIDDATANLIYFPIGTSASTSTLISLPENPLNNILPLERGEQLGLDMKNYVEAYAGSLQDHYTDLNGTDNVLTGWVSENATCTVGNNYPTAPAPGPFGPANWEWLNGKTSIYCERSVAHANNRLAMYLDFASLTTGYNQNGSIDLSDPSYIRYLVIQEDTDVGGIPGWGNNVSVGLQDTAGNVIYYTQWVAAPPNKQGYTGILPNSKWYEVTCHIGYDTQVGVAMVGPPDYWFFDVGAAPFLWESVERIWFSTLQFSPNPSWFVIDGLYIPTVDVSALSQNVVTPSPGYRMRAIDRSDIGSQFELQDFADDYLDKYIIPLDTLKVATIGQTGSRYAGQTVEVVAPLFGIGGPLITDTEIYRILELHHRVVKKSTDSEHLGFTFITEYDLIKNEVDGSDQELDPARYFKSASPDRAWEYTKRLTEKHKRTKLIKTAYVR